jgi:hypothetical protein
VVENEEEDQVAARIPFTGTITNPETSIWQTIASVLRNAFVSAFARSLEGSISIRDVRENLSGIEEGSGISNPEKDADNEESEKKDKDEKPRTGPRRG